jgi:hypothetical protein
MSSLPATFQGGCGMMRPRVYFLAISLAALLLAGCDDKPPMDEARLAGRAADTFPAADEDYFKGMDGNVSLTPDEVIGRNNWLVWTGGNDRFWNLITATAFGNFDLLKTISSHPSLPFGRDNRFEQLGLMNEPCFVKPMEGAKDEFGLWLDQRVNNGPGCDQPDPFANEKKYPGVQIGARGKTVPVGSFYGYPTGIVGLRLFPNPDFDETAKKNWDADRFYTDPSYYNDRTLVRPYRVGMACAFCHVGPSPTNPPADVENPAWENMSAVVGAQYFWIDRIFGWNYGGDKNPDQWKKNEKNYLIQLVHTSRPGALDTSLVSTDYINNPRTMNAVYGLGARMALAQGRGEEMLSGAELLNKQLPAYFKDPDHVFTPHVLKDGSDSVGVVGALNRVYINIGLFSEEWLRHFNPLFGGIPNTAIPIAVGRANSSYWQATEAQTPELAKYFLNPEIQAGHKLADAPGGQAYLSTDAAQLQRGKEVFADTCAGCHSSKAPAPPIDLNTCTGAAYLNCWWKYWDWVKSPEFKEKMRTIVAAPDFLDGNYLSTDMRVPVTLLQTNACSPLATNAISGNVWDNFSSTTYKQLPSVGTIKIHDPFTGEEKNYEMPAGGRGYTRVPSLVALWSTAPYLVNNSVGKFVNDPSVAGRIESFDASIHQMLWPESRKHDDVLAARGKKDVFLIDRTTVNSYLIVPGGFLPDFLRPLLSPLHRWFPNIFGSGELQVGPIPKGTPVNLLSNTELYKDDTTLAENLPRYVELLQLLKKATHDLKQLPKDPTDEQANKVFANLRAPLLGFSKCPDFEVNRGHYFGTGFTSETTALSDDEKNALIAFLKTF